MPAKKKVRKISEQNREILRKNFNKKLVQLHRIITDLSFSSEEISLQRNFIQEWFNQRIDSAIAKYREQIAKLQATSVEDMNFILERSERFYKRKYQKLFEMQNEYYKDVNSSTLDFCANSESECQKIRKEIEDINLFIINEQKIIDEKLNEYQNNLYAVVRDANEQGKKEIESYLKERSDELIIYQNNFDNKISILCNEHKMELDSIRNSKNDVTFNHCGTQYKLININEYKNIVQTIQISYNEKMVEIKSQINDEITDLEKILGNNRKENENMNSKLESDLLNMQNEVTDLEKYGKNNILNLTEKYNELKNYLSEIIEKNREALKEKRLSIDLNSESDCSTTSFLAQSLKSNRELLQQRILADRHKREIEVAKINEDIKSSVENFEKKINILVQEISAQKINQRKIIESVQKEYLGQIDSKVKEFNEEIQNLHNLFTESQKKGNQNELHYLSVIESLKKEKEILVNSNKQKLYIFDKEAESAFELLQKETQTKIKTVDGQISEMLKKEENLNNKKIEETKKNNLEQEKRFKSAKENELKQTIDLIQSCGYSKNEYFLIEKEYQDKYQTFQDQLRNSAVIIPESEVFKNMTRVISDLKAEKIDHETINQSRMNCLIFEWQQKIDEENSKFSKNTQKLNVSPRAREQAQKALLMKIEQIKKEKQEKIEFLNGLLKNSEENDEIHDDNFGYNKNDEMEKRDILNKLKNEHMTLIDQAYTLKEESLNQINKEIESVKSNLGLKKAQIKDKIQILHNSFREENKILSDSIFQIQQSYSDSKNSISNDFKSQINQLNQTFSFTRSQLLTDIENIRNLSSKASSDARSEWTMQRTLFDSQVSSLSEKLSSEMEIIQEEKENKSKNLDKKWKEILDRKAKMALIANTGLSSRSSDKALIDKLEGKLKTVTFQLSNIINDMVLYKNMYIEQESQINKKFGNIPDVGVIHKKHHNMDNVL